MPLIHTGLFQNYILTLANVKEYILNRDFDLINPQIGLFSAPCVVTKRIHRTPIVTHIHNIFDPSIETRFINVSWTLPENFLNGLAAKGSDKVIVLSRFMKKELITKFAVPAEKICIIPGGVDTSTFNPNTKKSSFREMWADKFVVLYVGRLANEKNVSTLLKSIQIVTEKNKEVLLVIAGSGYKQAYLESLANRLGINRYVTFLGHIPHEQLPYLYASCDVFVNPAIREPFGLTILEGMASGKPVIASKTGGMLDTVKDGENGLFFEPGDYENLADMLELLYGNQDMRNSIEQNARKSAEKYDWKIIAKQTLEVFEEVISKSS